MTLWAHQETGIQNALAAFERGQGHYAYFMEQGTGKTRTTIETMRQLFTRHRRPLMTLIVCPQIVVKNWQREIEKYSQMGRFVQLLTGDKTKRMRQLEQGKRDGKAIFVTNIEALASCEGLLWETRKRGKSESRLPVDHGWEMFVVDEAHRLKNPSAKSTKLAIKLADKCFFKYLLTGTPISQNEMDLWSLFRVLDGGQTFGDNFMAFKREWFIDMNAGMPSARYFPDWKIRPGSAAKMSELVYKKALRVTKEECLDLPPLVKTVVAVEMAGPQRRAYDEMKRDFITYLEGEACTAAMAMTKALRLQQLASGFAKLEDGREVQFPGGERLNALKDLLEDHPGKVIVWCAFRQNYGAVAGVCEKLGRSVVFITGDQSQAEKEAAEADFTKGSADVLVANPAAGGTGVNLVEAPLAIWFSRSFKAIDRWQAIARNHRGGSEMHEKVTMIDLVAEDSIDQHVLDALERKEDIAESILRWKSRV